MQEAAVRLDARELSAFEVEDFDRVVAGAADRFRQQESWERGEGDLHSKYWKMFMRTCCPQCLAGGVDGT